MAKQNLLLVDADPRSLRVLEVSLRKAGYSVASCEDASAALEMVELSEPDLILSDTRLPELDGFGFVEKLRESPEYAEIPLIFLSSDGSVESKVRGLELGVEDYLTKPIYIKEIITRVNLVLQRHERRGLERRSLTKTRFSGSLSEMGLVDLLQTIDISRKSGVLELSNGARSGTVHFVNGRLVHAESGKMQGDRAIYRFLVWNEGEFDLEFRAVQPEKETIQTSTQGLLMEGMRRVDEWGRMLEQLPPLESIFEVESDELLDRLAEIPDEINHLLRLFDGQHSLMDVVDAADEDDLQTLASISKLYFEGLIVDTGRTANAERDTLDAEAVVPGEPMLPDRADSDGVLTAEPAIVSDGATDDPEIPGDFTPVDEGTESAQQSASAEPSASEEAAPEIGTPDDDEEDEDDEADESADTSSGDKTMAKKGRSRRRRARRKAEDTKSNVIHFPAQKTASGEIVSPEPVEAEAPRRDDESGPQRLDAPVAEEPKAEAPAEEPEEAKAEAPAEEPEEAKAEAEAPEPEEAKAEPVAEPEADSAKAEAEVAKADEAKVDAAADSDGQPSEETVAKGVPVEDDEKTEADAAKESAAEEAKAKEAKADSGADRASDPGSSKSQGKKGRKSRKKKKSRNKSSGGDTGSSSKASDAKTASAAKSATAAKGESGSGKARSTAPAKGKGKETTSSQTIRAITETGEHAAVASDFFTAPSYEETIEPDNWDDLEVGRTKLSSGDKKLAMITGGTILAFVLIFGGYYVYQNYVMPAPAEMNPRATARLPEIPVMDDSDSYEDETDTELAEGELAEGETAEGELVEGETPEGELGEGELAEGELAEGETVEGETAEGETVEGETAEGEVAEAEAPPVPTGDYATLLEEANGLRGRRKEAKLREAIAANPLGGEALTELAWLLLNRGQYAEARDFSQRATTIDPTSSKAWITLGAARQSLRDNDGAMEAYRNCVETGTGQYVAECRRVLR